MDSVYVLDLACIFLITILTIYQQESNYVSDSNPLNRARSKKIYNIQITHINDGMGVAICICRPTNYMARVKNRCHSHA